MKYKLVDAEGNEYTLNDGVLVPSTVRGSFANSKDSYTFEQQIVKRSFLPGSEVVGTVRVESKSLVFTATFAVEDDAEHDAYVNTLLFWLKKAVIIKDITNNKQAAIAPLKLNMDYDKGSVKRSGEVSITFNLLDGYWESSTATTVVQSVPIGTTNIALNNLGWLEVYPTISVTVLTLCPSLDLYINETKEGIQFIDDTYGQITLRELVIDCKEGNLKISDFDRTQNITEGTGYFPIPIGASTFVIETPVASDIIITYNSRYYI